MRARVCLQNGTLKIVDRKKHIFKLAQGEYIAPEKIENIYMRSDAVAQVFVHGDSLQVGPLFKTASFSRTKSTLNEIHLHVVCLQACLVAVVVPDPDFLSDWTRRTLGLQGSYLELCGRAVMDSESLHKSLEPSLISLYFFCR